MDKSREWLLSRAKETPKASIVSALLEIERVGSSESIEQCKTACGDESSRRAEARSRLAKGASPVEIEVSGARFLPVTREIALLKKKRGELRDDDAEEVGRSGWKRAPLAWQP